MATLQPETIGNLLLSRLSPEEYRRLSRNFRPVALELREILFRPEDRIQEVHFPTTSIISLLTDLSDGSGLEVGLVGKEGLAGVSAILGGAETKVAACQAAGEAVRVSAEVIREEFRRGGAFQVALLQYIHTLMTQISQSVVCNVRHSIEGRLARWLLMYHDRLGRDEFQLTHEFMAAMLGVRRASVSEVAMKLQERRLIIYDRAHIKIIDRTGLERFVCECYPVVKRNLDDFP